jgi:hypothetical protein
MRQEKEDTRNCYRCYSVKMNQFLKENGLSVVKEVRHPKTQKIAFLYERTPELDRLLSVWSENGKFHKKGEE